MAPFYEWVAWKKIKYSYYFLMGKRDVQRGYLFFNLNVSLIQHDTELLEKKKG